MNQKRLFPLLAVLALLTLLAAGCAETTTNTNNANTANANTANANANMNANANANANRTLTREEFDKEANKYAQQAKETGRKIGAGANDAWLWAKTRSVLTTADDLRDSTINVDVDNGVITLSGTVATKEQLNRADALAKGIEGQKGVQNKLTVAPAGGDANKNSNQGKAKPKKG